MRHKLLNCLKRWWLLMLILGMLITFYSLGLGEYLSFPSLKKYQHNLITWTNENYILTTLTYCIVYTISVAISVPGAVILTLLGGFLFGPILGTLFVVISASLGAVLLFIAVKSAFAEQIASKAYTWVAKMQKGFKEDALAYLFILRLIPLFPFWAVNIVPALLGVNLKTYCVATFFGIIPGSAIYVAIGNGLSKTIASNQEPNLKIIFEPHILIPLIALAIITLIPSVYKKFQNRKHN